MRDRDLLQRPLADLDPDECDRRRIAWAREVTLAIGPRGFRASAAFGIAGNREARS